MKKQLWILALGIGLSPSAQAVTVFNDTFEPAGATAATRNDDAGAGVGLDVQWRPRVGSQAGAYSVVDDAVFGNALKFRQSGNSLWILGQFDSDASDDITLGAASSPVSLDLNSSLELSMKVRVATAISGTTRSFNIGLLNVPGGPLVADPGTDNTWINPAVGYFARINETTAAQVQTFKQVGSLTVTPYQGVAITNLSTGLTDATAVFGTDTDAHTILMRLTRTTAGVQVNWFWDGTLVSTAVDDGTKGGGSLGGPGPYTTFNTIGILYGTGNVDYILDDVKLEMVPEPGTAALCVLGIIALLGRNKRCQ